MNKEPKEKRKFEFPAMEKEILEYWEKEDVFQKSLAQTKGKQRFVFFEGPPTANGKPGIHHVLARVYKDIVLRYKTMQGFFVERKAGWDTHGLPVELQVEKSLNISGKPEIEKYGVAEFNKKCKESVWDYKKDWELMTKKIGFWLDLDDPYVTYENNYIESLWWIIKQVWDKDMLYQGYKVVPHCPRCGTALSSHEVAQGYKEVEENSVYIKFKVVGEENLYILSWTTTPWTLPGNVALAVGKDIDYLRIKIKKEEYIVAKEIAEKLFEDFKPVKEIKGKDLVGMKYEPLFDILNLQSDTSHQVYTADFVNTKEGTGVVHTAVMYGEDDYQLGEKVGLPKHHTVDENGNFTDEVPGFGGQFVKDKEVEKNIVKYLDEKGLLLKEELYKHDYPFCWRCDTPLLYYAKNSWFIKMSSLKEKLIKNNQEINWVPAYIKNGRFGEWLNELKDWAFSRERYWGTPLPIWEAEDGDQMCIGSIEELKIFVKDPSKIGDDFDMHRPFIDEIVLTKDGKEYKRIKEVADVWFDSGAMPFAQWHYPFENKERIDKGESFPADYISEAIDQTRGWFYTLLAVATLLGKGAPYKNVTCLNLILDNKGKKMSKSKGNIVDPFAIIDKYGADTLRWHLFTMNQPGDTKLFDEKNLEDIIKKNWMILSNVFTFWEMYQAGNSAKVKYEDSKHLLDRWVVAKLNELITSVTKDLDAYKITEAGRSISSFINDLSTWYVRRSRSRFKKEGEEKDFALVTLKHVLTEITKLLAPFVPFYADHMFQKLGNKKSVHLSDWIKVDKLKVDKEIIDTMAVVKQAVELGHNLRKDNSLKVRQPLSQFIIIAQKLNKNMIDIIKEEMNVDEVVSTDRMPTGKEFAINASSNLKVALDTTITDELKHRGIVRDMIRQINSMRKDAKLTINDTISVYYNVTDQEIKGILMHYKKEFIKEVIASKCLTGIPDNVDLKKVLEINGKKVIFGLKKN
ncbi:MAG: isoleucine--tRNA ligase [bacterium]|nr:isoleucine--tRNA ligase [bacterium]